MLLMNQPFLPNNFNKALDLYDDPPTLYSIMQSIVNFENDNPVKIKDLPELSRSTIFDFDYPSTGTSFDKAEFERMFLTHYMFRRINYDTLTSFKLHLNVKLHDIMPKYIKMFDEIGKLNFDGTKEVHERTMVDNKESTSSGTSTGTTSTEDATTSDNRFSNTPQNNINDIKNGEYMSEYTYTQNNSNASTDSETNSTTESSDTSNVKEDIIITRGDNIEEYQKYQELSLNIYSMIYHECDELFYGIM